MGIFNNIIGHEKQKNILSKLFIKNRVSTSYIFSGESGIGKKLLAKEFVKLLNCQKPIYTNQGIDACDRCLSCKKFINFNHPDFMIIEPEKGIIKIEKIRELQEFLFLKPYEGKIKAVLIDDADCMNLSSANAILKILEEPPQKSIIILISMYPERLPETIRSRCFNIKFSLLSENETKEVIKKFIFTKKYSLKDIARIAMGRPAIIMEKNFLNQLNKLIKDIKKAELSEKWTDKLEMLQWFNIYEIFLRDIIVGLITEDSSFLIIPDVKEILLSYKNLALEDIIKIYEKVCWLKEKSLYNLNISIIHSFINTQIQLFTK